MQSDFIQLMKNMDIEMERTKKQQSEVRLLIKGAISLNQQFKERSLFWGKIVKK